LTGVTNGGSRTEPAGSGGATSASPRRCCLPRSHPATARRRAVSR